jgi:hypothetical protein
MRKIGHVSIPINGTKFHVCELHGEKQLNTGYGEPGTPSFPLHPVTTASSPTLTGSS